jgi:uncharacterized protein
VSGHPLFFGDSASPLFGVYHAPSEEIRRQTAVLICPPFMHENIRTHRLLRQVALRLVREGFPVLRFDFFGEGDSSGDGGEGDGARWVDDVGMAAEELMGTSGVANVALLGLRLGASVAALAAAKGLETDRIVLWDPVLEGVPYLDSLEAMHQKMLRNGTRFLNPRTSSPEELLGFPFPSPRRAFLRELTLWSLDLRMPRRIALIASSDRVRDREWIDHLGVKGLSVKRQVIPTEMEWESEGAIEKALTASEPIFTALVGAVTEAW